MGNSAAMPRGFEISLMFEAYAAALCKKSRLMPTWSADSPPRFYDWCRQREQFKPTEFPARESIHADGSICSSRAI